MSYRKGYMKVTMTPTSFGAATQAAKRILADLRDCAAEMKNIGYDIGTLEAATADAEVVESIAFDDIDSGQVVLANGHLASASNVGHAGRVLGVAAQGAVIGQRFVVVVRGPATVPGVVRGDIVWLGDDGSLVVTVPTSGFSQKLGLAIDDGLMVVCPSDPIILA